MPADEIAVVVPSLDRVRSPLETAFGSLGIPYSYEGRLSLRRTPFGTALLGLLRFAWLGGGRRDLFTFLRSRFSGLARTRADFVEGRLRGRGIRTRVASSRKPSGSSATRCPPCSSLQGEEDPLASRVRSSAG